MKTKLYIFSIFIFLHSAAGQQLIVKKQDSLIRIASNTQIAATSGMSGLSMRDGNSQIRFIVELDEQPNIVQRIDKTQSKLHLVSAKRNLFKTTISETVRSIKIIQEFSEVLSGFCILSSYDEREKISKISGVKRIYEDISVNAFPVSTSTFENFSESPIPNFAKGKGIRVGIIDTGIDYLHEALGGGFGAGFKVAGGYDFINEDSDPRDDNGHGTHVAGIIAGSSASFSGMAPHATLYSYKALDAGGSGYTSTVIASIEQAIKDNIQVLNLSLGCPSGDPDDILSQAVNRAVQAGIVVVAAAGNFSGAGTIGSPGAAKLALTVGAIDANNRAASFSSKGPVMKSFGFKPDVSAPGVNVISAKLGGGYIGMSGTSMAAPHVAGLAAALLELHSDWSEIQIRNAIIQGTQKLALPLFAIGAGKINSERTAAIKTIVLPSTLSFGFNAMQNEFWNKKDTIRIINLSSAKQTYRIAQETTIPGVIQSFSKNELPLNANEEQSIIVESIINNSILPDNKNIGDGYLGTIAVFSLSDTVFIPYGFFKGNILHLTFDEIPWQVVVHNGKGISKSVTPKTNTISFVLNADTYDVLTNFYRSHYVVKENISVKGNIPVTVNKTDAVHKITISPIDESEKTISASSNLIYSSVEGIFHKQTGTYVISMAGAAYNKPETELVKFISSLSNKYTFGYALNILDGNTKTYSYQTSLDSGITKSSIISFTAASMKKVDVKYDVDSSSARKLFPITWAGIKDNSGWLGVTFYNENAHPLSYPYVQSAYYFGSCSQSFPLYHLREGYRY